MALNEPDPNSLQVFVGEHTTTDMIQYQRDTNGFDNFQVSRNVTSSKTLTITKNTKMSVSYDGGYLALKSSQQRAI
jgi:hypothetical protein